MLKENDVGPPSLQEQNILEHLSSFPTVTALRGTVSDAVSSLKSTEKKKHILYNDLPVTVFQYNTWSNTNWKVDATELESYRDLYGLEAVSLILCELIIL